MSCAKRWSGLFRTRSEVDVTFFDWMLSVLPGAGLLFLFSALSFGGLSAIYRWVLGRRRLWRILFFPVPAALFAVALWASMTQFIHYHEQKYYAYAGPPAADSLGARLMHKVAGMRALVAEAPHPVYPEEIGLINAMHFAGGLFDAGAYFTVLTNLQQKAGYELDYVHTEGLNGFPILYARKTGKHLQVSDVEDFIGPLVPGPGEPEDHCLRDWSPAIGLKPSREAFLELAALHLVGNQFYLFWHAGYNDRQIVATAEKLEEIINSEDLGFGSRLPVGYRMKARELDVRPVVEFVEEDAVWVDLLTFTKWGGFMLEKLAFSTKYPHKLLLRESEPLIEFDCGICY